MSVSCRKFDPGDMLCPISSIYVLEVRCLPLPTWGNSMVLNSSETGYKAVVNYTCLTAPDQGPYITMCGEDALWRPPIKDCESTVKSSFLFCNSFNTLAATKELFFDMDCESTVKSSSHSVIVLPPLYIYKRTIVSYEESTT